jgi:hypothetical protein
MNQDRHNHQISNIQSMRGTGQKTHLGGLDGPPPLARAEMREFTSSSPPSASPSDPEHVSPNELEHSVVSSPSSSLTRSGDATRGPPPFMQMASVLTTAMLLWFLERPPPPSSSAWSMAGAGAGAGAMEPHRNSPPNLPSFREPCGRTDHFQSFSSARKLSGIIKKIDKGPWESGSGSSTGHVCTG